MRLRKILSGMAMLLFVLGGAQTAFAQTTVSAVAVTNKLEQAVIGGTVTVGDTVAVTIHDLGLPGGQEVVSYVAQTGDTKGKIATGLAQAINADTNLGSIGVSAHRTTDSSSPVVTMTSNSPNPTSYTGSLNPGGTETLNLSVNTNVAENATISGTATAGDVVSITVIDLGLAGGQQVISYSVVAGDTPTSIATGLAAAATANTVLTKLGITATSASQYLTIESHSLNTTTYSDSVIGNTETIVLTMNPNSVQDIVVGGSPAAGNVLTLQLSDVGLPSGPEFVSSLAKAGDTVAMVCTNLKNAIKNDANLQASGISSTCNSGVLSIESDSPNQTNVSFYAVDTAPSCTVVPAPWKGVVLKQCGAASANAVSVVNSTLIALSNTNNSFLQDSATKLKANNTFTYYVYRDQIEFYSSIFGRGVSAPAKLRVPKEDTAGLIPASAYGATYYGASGPPYVVIFEYTGVATNIQNQIIGHTVAHETGHLLDDVIYAN